MEMTPPQATPELPALTPAQAETADFFIDVCGLHSIAEHELDWMGMTGTVRYGLGRCGDYLEHMTPQEVRDLVLTMLEKQQEAAEQ